MDTKKKKKVVDLSRIENYDTQTEQNKTENKKQREKQMELTDAQARHGVRELIRESKARRVDFRVEVPTKGEVYHDGYYGETTITVKLVVPTDHLVEWAKCEYTGDAPC